MYSILTQPELLHDARAGVVVAPDHAEWPRRCVCCNADVDAPPLKLSVSKMSLVSWLGVAVIFAPLPLLDLRVPLGLIIAVIFRTRRRFDATLCDGHRKAYRTRQGLMGGLAMVFIAVAAFEIASGSVDNPEPWAMGGVAAAATLITAVFASWFVPVAKVVAIEPGLTRLWLRGDGEFRRSLPKTT